MAQTFLTILLHGLKTINHSTRKKNTMTFHDTPFSIHNYSLDLCTDDYLIRHFNDLSPENQQTILTFLHYMEELKNSANDYTPIESNIDAEYVFVDYTDDVVNTLTNHILATWKDNYQEQLTTIKKLNQLFKTNAYKTLFYNDLKQTPIEYLIKEDDEFKLEQGESYLKHLETNHQKRTPTYTIAITDGGYMPINIKTNLTLEATLKEALSHTTPKDIKNFCDLYAISTKDHQSAIYRIQEIVENHIKKDNNFYYNDNGDNLIISINLDPKSDPLNNIRIEIGGYDFFAFAKPEEPLNQK